MTTTRKKFKPPLMHPAHPLWQVIARILHVCGVVGLILAMSVIFMLLRP